MNAIIYDSKRVFWPVNAPASSIPIDIKSDSEISSVSTVQEAIQMIVDDIGFTVKDLPKEDLDPEYNNLSETIDCVNEILHALRNLKLDGKRNP